MNRAELNGSVELDTGNRGTVNAAVGQEQFQKPAWEEHWSLYAKVLCEGQGATETDGGNSGASRPYRRNAEPGQIIVENYIHANLLGAHADCLLCTYVHLICCVNQAGLNGSIQIHANCPELSEGAAGEEGKLNFAFDIPRSFDAEVLNSGAVVEVPAGETLEFSIAQGRNFDRRFEISYQALLQQVPIIAYNSVFDPTAEMQGKQKLVSSTVVLICSRLART